MQENNEKDTETMQSIDPNEIKSGISKPIDVNDLEPIVVNNPVKLELEKNHEEIKETHGKIMNELFDWLESILVAVISIVIIFTFILRVNTVDGVSMMPTLIDGQKLIVSDMFYTPNYNDIVIIQAANLDGGKPIVKRVIALPGDTIRIDFDNGVVYRNGEALELEVVDGLIYEDGHTINAYTTRRLDMSDNEVVVPDDCYFVMGDNRNESADSRDRRISFVDKHYIAGRAIFSVFPFDTFGAL